MSNFDKAVSWVLSNEDAHMSGVVTTDSGGRTRWGIAEKSNSSLPDGFYTFMSLNESLGIAKDIYRNQYWQPICGDEIRDDSIGTKILDMAVNNGVSTAVKMLQNALNATGATLICDGHIGPNTLACVNQIPADQLMPVLVGVLTARYQAIVQDNPDNAKYLQGWLNRAQRIPS